MHTLPFWSLVAPIISRAASIVIYTFTELRTPTPLLLFQGTLLHHLRERLEVLDEQQRGD